MKECSAQEYRLLNQIANDNISPRILVRWGIRWLLRKERLMKMKYLLTTSALAVGFFLSTQAGQASHIPNVDPQKNPPSLAAGTSTLPDSLENQNITLRGYQSAAEAYLLAHNYTEFANVAEKMPEGSQILPWSFSLKDYRKTAEKILEIKKYDIAAKIYEEFIRMFPQAVTADDYRNAAIAHFRAKNDARTIQFCRMFVERDPHLAVEIYEQVFRTHPQHRTLNNYRGAAKANYHAEFYDKATKFYEVILDRDPWSMTDEDYNFVSMAYVREGNLLRASDILVTQSNLKRNSFMRLCFWGH